MTNPWTYSTSISLEDWELRHYIERHGNKRDGKHRSRHHLRLPQIESRKKANFVSILKFLAVLKQYYQKLVDYPSRDLIHKSQWYNVNVNFESWKMDRKISVQVKDRNLNGKNHSTVIDCRTKVEQLRDTSRIHERTAVWLCRDITNGTARLTIETQLSLSLIDQKKHKAL